MDKKTFSLAVVLSIVTKRMLTPQELDRETSDFVGIDTALSYLVRYEVGRETRLFELERAAAYLYRSIPYFTSAAFAEETRRVERLLDSAGTNEAMRIRIIADWIADIQEDSGQPDTFELVPIPFVGASERERHLFMQEAFGAAEKVLPQLLADEARWNSLYVDYHPPYVERLWTQLGAFRPSLHKIHPCEPGQALFHPHPWPAAMRILPGLGKYEMDVGFGAGDEPPPIASRLRLAGDSTYIMSNRDGWHSVRPIGAPVHTFMLTGPTWDRNSPGKGKPLRALTEAQQQDLFSHLRRMYPA